MLLVLAVAVAVGGLAATLGFGCLTCRGRRLKWSPGEQTTNQHPIQCRKRFAYCAGHPDAETFFCCCTQVGLAELNVRAMCLAMLGVQRARLQCAVAVACTGKFATPAGCGACVDERLKTIIVRGRACSVSAHASGSLHMLCFRAVYCAVLRLPAQADSGMFYAGN